MRLLRGYTNVLVVLTLCLAIQCVFSSGDVTKKEKIGVKDNEPVAQQDNQVRTSAAQSVPNENTVSPLKDGDATNTGIGGVSRQLNSSQETVQPSHKMISTGAFVRAFYVFVGLCAIVVMYIVVRTVRLNRKKTSVRKYGILTNREDVEMTPLGAGDEEEDATLFDMTLHKSRP